MPRSSEGDPGDYGMMAIPPDAAVSADHRNPRRRRGRRRRDVMAELLDPQEQQEGGPTVGTLVTPEARHSLDKLVLRIETREAINAGLRSIEMRQEMEEVWNIAEIQPQKGRCILNFWGSPGTGKTRAALGIALKLAKPLYQVDYSSVISKYLGDTAKHISAAFREATEEDAVLFFDEADSLLSKRVDMNESCATSINQNRNVLMQELDRFPGVVIMTTNLFGNYDEALLRRIASHIEFKLPNRSMRKQLFAMHLPMSNKRKTVDLDQVAGASKELSGGDILNACLNGIYAASQTNDTSKWVLTTDHLLAEVAKIKASKTAHAERKSTRRQGYFGFAPVQEPELEN